MPPVDKKQRDQEEQPQEEPTLEIWEETGFGTDQTMVSAYNLETDNSYTIDDYQKNESLGADIDQWALEKATSGSVDSLLGTVDVYGIEDQELASSVSDWDIERNLAMEGMVLFTEDYGNSSEHEDLHLEYAIPVAGQFLAAADQLGFGLNSGDSAFEKYVDANDLEEFGYNDYVSTGMTFEEFAKEWKAANPDKAPTQQDYEAWILWGNPGALYAESHGAEKGIDLGKKLNSLGLDGTAYEGKTVDFYTPEALEYAAQNGMDFDFLNDGQTAIVPTGTEFANSRYKVQGEIIPGWTMVTKVQEEEWYEEDWAMYTVMAASVVAGIVTGGATTALTAGMGFWGTLGTSMAIGAAQGAVSAGLITETAGGDFEDGAKVGAISGGISGATSTILSELVAVPTDPLADGPIIEAGSIEHAIASGAIKGGANYLQTQDLESALISGAVSGLGTQEYFASPVKQAALSVGGSLVGGEDDFVKIGIGAAGSYYQGKKIESNIAEKKKHDAVMNKYMKGWNANRYKDIAKIGIQDHGTPTPDVLFADKSPVDLKFDDKEENR